MDHNSVFPCTVPGESALPRRAGGMVHLFMGVLGSGRGAWACGRGVGRAGHRGEAVSRKREEA